MIEEAKKRFAELVERFRQNADAYRAASYNETQARQEFINPFFEILGWDVQNRAGYAEQYKDCVHEDSIKVGVSLKAPDYSFRIGGQRKFFLEAKKPSVNIKDDINPALQLRRYAWSAKLPLSIVTDFEELAVYDCRIKPGPKDKVSDGRIAYYTYGQYLEKFDEIYGTFSKDAVLKGSFDRYIVSSKAKKGTAEVDKEFLGEIEAWRVSLCKNLALRNHALTVDELNFAVQHTLDRIIFLRICEDRGIEIYGQLQALLNGGNVYGRLLGLFYKADDKYNSGLFDFKADTLSHALTIDDAVLKETIENLYYPKSPYEFSVIGADILGSVYERFLGKVISLTAGHQARVEDKPEVKKAGGVYYTPAYIVEYIVKNTVGPLVDDRTPAEISKLRFIDPACGSGSFLIGAYQHLLARHIRWYTENNPEKFAKGKTPAIYHGAGGWRLTTSEKKRILLNNIHGVDIDRQAVEVTKLSLLLKVLEDENGETLGKNLALFHERVLPNLEDNVKCGNSLIGPDFYNQMSLGLDNEDMRRINVFDWNDDEKGFGKIMNPPLSPLDKGGSKGGFDAVIGNPPYVRQEMLGEFKPYFETHYKTYNGVADLYVYFIEKGVSLLKEEGLFGYIVANKWMRANYGEPIRRWMKTQAIEEIVDFGDLPVFQQATTYPCILRISKGRNRAKTFSAVKVDTLDFKDLQTYVKDKGFSVPVPSLDDKGWSLSGAKEAALLAKLKTIGVPLGEYVEGKIYRGILTGLNEAFVINAETRKRLIKEDPKSAELIKPFLAGRDVKRYKVPESEKYLIFTRHGIDIKNYPAIEKHLTQFKEQLAPKPKDWKGKNWKGRKPGTYKWYEIQDTIDYYSEFEKPKIVFPDISISGSFTLDKNSNYSVNTTYIIPVNDLYLLGLLNSNLVTYFYAKISSSIRGGYLRFIYQYVTQLPIRAIDVKKPDDKATHDKIVSLALQMLSLNKRLADAKTPHDKELLERRIKATDKQIDDIVYGLYGITADERKIIEGKG